MTGKLRLFIGRDDSGWVFRVDGGHKLGRGGSEIGHVRGSTDVVRNSPQFSVERNDIPMAGKGKRYISVIAAKPS